MTLRKVLRCAAAGLAALAVLVPTGAPPAHAGPCVRTVLIDPQVTVGEGAGNLVFYVYSQGCAAAGSVGYTTASGTATAGTDFVPVSGRIPFAGGDLRTQVVVISVLNDALPEPDVEDLALWLVAPSPDVVVRLPKGVGRLLDNDTGRMLVALDDVICLPGVEGPVTMAAGLPATGAQRLICDLHTSDVNVCACINVPPTNSLLANWSTVDGTAHAGVDFVGVNHQWIMIPAGASKLMLPVDLILPGSGIAGRYFMVTIDVPSAVVVDSTATVTLYGP